MEIYKWWKVGGFTKAELSRQYGVCRERIGQIIKAVEEDLTKS